MGGEPAPFPGRWLGGISCIAGPLAVLTGVLLRVRFDFFFPAQLAAYDRHPGLMAWSYGAFAVGMVLLVPAVLTLAARIAATRPSWALWGAAAAIAGLCARLFHAGVDHMAFQLVRVQGYSAAHDAVAESYTAFYPLQVLNPLIMAGWVVLAVGAFLSGAMGLARSAALGSMAALMIGVLKGTTLTSVAVTSALCFALIPLGIAVLRAGPAPSPRAVAGWSAGAVAALGLLYFLGTAG
ncbi:hypothetical protein FZ103_01130 [Streptomonospora sp. PA3]|nr:hypothetical protein [Streptomonospora sp. PA3]